METRFRTYDKEHPTGLTEFQYTSLLVGAVCQSMYCVSGKGSDGVLIVLGLSPVYAQTYDGSRVSWL